MKAPVSRSRRGAAQTRRTQEERSAATRIRLLDATVDCLHALGYARTTTTEVVLRAKLSRGAQLHHFPTKRELVTSAIEHLLARREAEFRARFADVVRDASLAERVKAAIDLLWEMMEGPVFFAWLEIAVAARTEPALRAAFRQVNERFAGTVLDTFRDLFPEARGSRLSEAIATLAFAVLEGLALDRAAMRKDSRVLEALGLFRALAAQLFPRGGTP
jgi:AcrR family transcriptional regulator